MRSTTGGSVGIPVLQGREDVKEEDIASRYTPSICRHDLAFLRALVEGVPLPSATLRYLPSITVHSAPRHLIRLLDTSIAMLRSKEQHEMATALSAWQSAQSALVQSESAKWTHPSVRGLDRSQIHQVVEALDFILGHGVSSPRLSDELSQWLKPSLHERLQTPGIATVGDLIEFIDRHGPKWYRRVPGLGWVRGSRLVSWLKDHGELLEQAGFGMLPATGANALGKDIDRSDLEREALRRWLAKLDHLSALTRGAYSTEVARLLLWARVELAKSLLDLNVTDALAYTRFLIAKQDHRKPPTDRGLVGVRHFYRFLVASHYLRESPF